MINDGLKNRTRETFDLLNLRKPCEEDGSCIFGAFENQKDLSCEGLLGQHVHVNVLYQLYQKYV